MKKFKVIYSTLKDGKTSEPKTVSLLDSEVTAFILARPNIVIHRAAWVNA